MSTAVRLRPSARLVVAAVLAALAFGAVGCADDVSGTARVDAADLGAYRAEMSASASASARDDRNAADYAACSTATSASAAMLAAYNPFVTSLNATQAYGALKGADLAAIAALDRGAASVRAALAPATGDAIRGAATRLADRAGALAAVIRAKGRDDLNGASSAFRSARDDVLAACRAFDSPAPSAAGAPSSGAPSSAPPTSPR